MSTLADSVDSRSCSFSPHLDYWINVLCTELSLKATQKLQLFQHVASQIFMDIWKILHVSTFTVEVVFKSSQGLSFFFLGKFAKIHSGIKKKCSGWRYNFSIVYLNN